MQPRCEHRYARWPTRLENVEPAMNHLSIPADRVRHIEQDGLFGTWDWDFASGAVSWSDGSFRLLGFEPGSVIRFPADHFGWTGLGHQWKFVPVRRSWLSSSMQRWAMTASRSASVAK